MAARTAAEADPKAAAIPSPMAENTLPLCSAITWRSNWSWQDNADRMAVSSRCHNRVDPSISVNRNVAVPDEPAITPQHPTSAAPAAGKTPIGAGKTVPTAQVADTSRIHRRHDGHAPKGRKPSRTHPANTDRPRQTVSTDQTVTATLAAARGRHNVRAESRLTLPGRRLGRGDRGAGRPGGCGALPILFGACF